jgi:hypothetical protein
VNGDYINPELADWGFVGMLYHMASEGGAILGPYGLSTAWRRGLPFPNGDVPGKVHTILRASCGHLNEGGGDMELNDGAKAARDLLASKSEICQWDNEAWIVPDTAKKKS